MSKHCSGHFCNHPLADGKHFCKRCVSYRAQEGLGKNKKKMVHCATHDIERQNELKVKLAAANILDDVLNPLKKSKHCSGKLCNYPTKNGPCKNCLSKRNVDKNGIRRCKLHASRSHVPSLIVQNSKSPSANKRTAEQAFEMVMDQVVVANTPPQLQPQPRPLKKLKRAVGLKNLKKPVLKHSRVKESSKFIRKVQSTTSGIQEKINAMLNKHRPMVFNKEPFLPDYFDPFVGELDDHFNMYTIRAYANLLNQSAKESKVYILDIEQIQQIYRDNLPIQGLNIPEDVIAAGLEVVLVPVETHRNHFACLAMYIDGNNGDISAHYFDGCNKHDACKSKAKLMHALQHNIAHSMFNFDGVEDAVVMQQKFEIDFHHFDDCGALTCLLFDMHVKNIRAESMQIVLDESTDFLQQYRLYIANLIVPKVKMVAPKPKAAKP